MAILADADTRVICQGFTGRQATFYSERAIARRTQMVGGVRPGRGGEHHLGQPVFDTVREAREATDANASLVFVPRAFAAAAMIEAIEAGIELIVCVTERIPVLDMARVKAALAGSSSLLIGPNSPGIVTAGACRIGVMPYDIFKPGCVGIVSRSSTLTYEAVLQTSESGHGQTTCVGIGGDPLHGLGFPDLIERFDADPATRLIVLVGEIGGAEEERAAEYLDSGRITTPVVACIAGRHAPEGRRMGHAGAVVERGAGTAASKIAALRDAGAIICPSPAAIGATVSWCLRSR